MDFLDLTEANLRALKCWELMDDNEKMAVRIGMLPLWTAQEDLGGKCEGWTDLTKSREMGKEVAVRIMQLAKQNGGMIA